MLLQRCIDISEFYPCVSGFSFSKLHKNCCKSGSEELQCLYFQLLGITIAEVHLPRQTILEDHTHIHQEDYNGKGAKQSRWNPLQHHIVCTPA